TPELQLAEFEPQQLRVPPAPGDRQLIVGQHVGALLRLAPARGDHHRDLGDAELPGGRVLAAIAATCASVWVRAFFGVWNQSINRPPLGRVTAPGNPTASSRLAELEAQQL